MTGPTLIAAVGFGGQNDPLDVRAVQSALNRVGAQLAVDGVCGNRTVAAIREFQRGFMVVPDGRVDPGGRTLAKLDRARTLDVPSAPRPDGWDGDAERWPQAKKLDSLAPEFREKVERVLVGLNEASFMPKVVYGWRSIAVQMELFRKGNSKVRFGFHNVARLDGTPAALAVDIIDRRYAWSDLAERAGFWSAYGRLAAREGLVWGGSWTSYPDLAHIQMLSNSQLAAVRRASGIR